MRSCGFSAPARVAVAVSILLAVACGSVALAAPARRPAAAPSPVVPAADQQEFLLLPAHDLEPAGAPGELRVGDVLQFVVRNGDPSWSPRLPEGTSAEGWALAVPGGNPPSPLPELRIRIVLTRPGELRIPSLLLADPAGKAVARTNPWNPPAGASVASAIRPDDPKAQEPVPALPPVHLQFPLWLVALLVLGALLLIGGLVYAAVRWSRRRKPAIAAPVKVEPVLPEDEAALKALSELEKAGHLRRGEFKKHYFAISEILKAYIGARYRFDAPESTSREIVSTLEERKSVPDATVDRLESLLQLLDRVKFTDHVPESGEPERLIAEAREFVENTRRPRQITPEASDAVR